jgi:Ca-activated chloride channel family protein
MTDFFADIKFADPWFFLLLLLVPVFIWYSLAKGNSKYVSFRISDLSAVSKLRSPARVRWMAALPVLRILAFIMIVTALARPQTGFSNKKITSEGIDIMLAIDISSSMYAIDFRPNRMAAAKEAAKEFIDARPNDRIGLVVFAGEAFTQCPATLDHELLKRQIDEADNWQLDDGTALGDGLFMAVSRLSDTTHVSTKVIILLSDGVRTAGKFSPIDAANAAKQLNMRVYTIGVGSETNRPIPVVDKNGRAIYELDPRISFDEPTLTQVSELTGGKYFRVTTREKLSEVYQEIDQIEKQKMQVDITKRYDEKFHSFALAGLLFLLLELILANSIFRTIT